ncbi:MAG: recombinase family protein [Janthinobacterium lividum]
MKNLNSRTPGAVIYTRVSTNEQVENGTSLASQRDACMRVAQNLGLEVVDICEDAGVSGTRYQTREGINKALKYIESGQASVLIATKIDRVGRSAKVVLDVVDRIEKANGELITEDVKFDKSATGRFMRTIWAAMGEMEKDNIRDRMMGGKHQRVAEGQQPQRSRPPYGYHIVTNAEVECEKYPTEMRGRYVVNDNTAPVAIRIYNDYVGGVTLPKLVRALNSEGIPTPGNCRLWKPATVHLILTNSVYKGEPISGRQRCHADETRLDQRHKLTGLPITRTEVRRLMPEDKQVKLFAPALVSKELWEAVQQTLETNRTFRKGNPRRVLMLSGKTFCQYCGGRTGIKYQNANGKRYTYLVCGQQLKAASLTGEKPCRGDRYPLSLIEASTVSVLQEVWQKPEAIAATQPVYLPSDMALSEDPAILRQEIAQIGKALDELKQENNLTMQAQLAGMRAGAPSDLYNERFSEIAARRAALEQRREMLSLSLTNVQKGQKDTRQQHIDKAALQAVKEAHRVLSSPDVPGVTKREILLTIVDRVVCYKDGVKVYFAPGLFEGAEGKKSDINFYTTCMGIRTQR